MPEYKENIADILKAIAQPARLKIIDFLMNGEKCVCEIFPAIDYEQSNTSRHLNFMHKIGILSRRKDGVKIMYKVKHPEVFQIATLAATIYANEIEMHSKKIKNR